MISIGFSTTNGFFSKVIRKITKAQISHVWIRYYHELYKDDVVVSAGIRGIIEIPYREYHPTIVNVIELVPPSSLDLSKGMPAILEVLGDNFDTLSLLGRAWVYFKRWIGRKVKNPLGNPNVDCCVDNAYRLLISANAIDHDVDVESESPKSLYDRLIKDGWSKRPA